MSIDINTVGPLANKRFFSTSTVGSEAIQYILCNINSDTGSQLGIVTSVGELAGTLDQKAVLVPKLPYRMMAGPAGADGVMNWEKFIEEDWMGEAGANLDIEKEFLQFYNPGMWMDGTSFKCNLNGVLDSKPDKTPFAEINWSRDGLRGIGTELYSRDPKTFNIQYFGLPGESPIRSGFVTQFNRTKMRVHDTHASMVVVNYDNNTDHIYLGVCSRVDLRPEMINSEQYYRGDEKALFSDSYNTSLIWYSIPTVIKLVVERSAIRTSTGGSIMNVVPKLNQTGTRVASWTYPGATKILRRDSDRKFNNIIPDTSYSNPATSLWNFNLIPGYHSFASNSSTQTRAYIPTCVGATIDLDYDDTNKIVCSTTVGYFDASNVYKLYHEVSKFDFTTPTGFFYNSTGNYHSEIYTGKFIKNQTICKESGGMFVSALGLYPDTNSDSMTQDTVLNFTSNDLTTNKKFTITGLESPDLVERNNLMEPDNNLTFAGRYPLQAGAATSQSGLLVSINHVSSFIAGETFDGNINDFLTRISNQDYCSILAGVPKEKSPTSTYYKTNINTGWRIEGTRFNRIYKKIDVKGADRSFDIPETSPGNTTLMYYGFLNSQIYHAYQNIPNRSNVAFYPWVSPLEINNLYSQDDFKDALPSYTGFSAFGLNANLPTRGESFYTHPIPAAEEARNPGINAGVPIVSTNNNGNPFRIGTDYTVDFSPSPTFGFTNPAEAGIPISIHFIDCSGIKSVGPITNGAIVPQTINGRVTNGVPVNLNYQPIIGVVDYWFDRAQFNSLDHSSQMGTLGYIALGEQVHVSLLWENNNLLLNGPQMLTPNYYYYDQGGNFRFFIQPILYLTSSNTGGQDFKDPSFLLTNCYIELRFIKNGQTFLHRQNITIDPPNGSCTMASIGLETARPKTVSDIHFQLTRDANLQSSSYTTVLDLTQNKYLMATKTVTPTAVTVTSTSPQDFNILNSSLKRGDCIFYSYKPYLGGVKPIVDPLPAKSNIVSNCTGHKYYLEDVSLLVDEGGGYSDDLLDLIRDTDPSYVYLNLALTSAPLAVTSTILNEDWLVGPNDPRHVLSDEDIYPFIASGFILASEFLHSDTLNSVLQSEYFDYPTPHDGGRTYPNVRLNLSELNRIINTNTSGEYWDYISWSDNLLPDEACSMILTIEDLNVSRPGKYRIYMGIVDEFEQVSLWCITNKIGNYKILGGT